MHSNTPLARWLNKKHRTVSGFAREAGISRPRLYHYIHGYAVPTEPVLSRLCELTGLKRSAFQKHHGKDAA